MKFRYSLLSRLFFWVVAFMLVSCADDDMSGPETKDSGDRLASFDGEGGGTGGSSGNGQGGGEAGLVTAGEWNDLDNWNFWTTLINGQDFGDKEDYWGFYTNQRVAVSLTDQTGRPINGVRLTLKMGGQQVWDAVTDNFGRAELWVNLFEKNEQTNNSGLELYADDVLLSNEVKFFDEQINEFQLDNAPVLQDQVELAFVVDATGSMSDELEFLKKDLQDVINRVGQSNGQISILTSAVFYRDQGDEYVTKTFHFTSDFSQTLNFIKDQFADGGGDYPEAVHSALTEAVSGLQWSSTSKTRIAFLLLDAPPHYEPQVIDQIQNAVSEAARKGIKLIPVAASGVNKETEFLLRFSAMATNGTYVFITNDSGIGNDHIEASVGEFQVELLNDLMVRLINKYVEFDPEL